MSKSDLRTVDIFLTLDQNIIDGYYNKHDPSPIYKRQLRHQFEEYILASVSQAKRHSPIFYKLRCSRENDKQYAEPLLYSIRRHFMLKKQDKELEFKRFKRRNFAVLAIAVAFVILCQGIVPLLLNSEQQIHTGLSNSLDVFSWVILWHPIDELVFHWNPHLKDICLLNKLASAESIIIENEKSLVVDNSVFRVVA